jgi:serine/threonine protein kinase/class 3 adenylate cyclase
MDDLSREVAESREIPVPIRSRWVMSLDRYQLLAQVGAGPDGVAYRAVAEDGVTVIEIRDLSRARDLVSRWERLVPRLRLAAQLKHPTALQVLDLGLEKHRPYVVLEWVDTATMAASGPKTREEAIESIMALAGALDEAHHLGLAHGRLGPGHVLLTVANQSKLDFTGADAGFPAASETERALDAACRDRGSGGGLAADRAADLFGLGILLVWLLTGRTDSSEHELRTAGLDAGSPLGDLVRRLLADDPAERPTAREVRERLARLAVPLEATGDWSKSGPTPARPLEATGEWSKPGPTVGELVGMARSRRVETIVAGSKPETSVLDAETAYPRLGRYRLLEKLGEGGQGVVYRAEDPAEGSIVAIKVLRTDRAGDIKVLQRFRKEARLMAEANNPFVVNLLEYNEEDDLPYLVLEFVAGESLSNLLAQRTRLDEATALAIMAGVARGLMEAHERGIVHRDIKPSNILLLERRPAAAGPLADTAEFVSSPESTTTSATGSVGVELSSTVPGFPSTVVEGTITAEPAALRIKISDFGLARHVVDTESLALTAAGALLGTPHYMAPEQWTGRDVDPRTDVYAMGATLYHLLAGRPPFAGPTRDALGSQHCNEAPPALAKLNPDISEGVARVVERALAKRPEDRYIDAGAMLRDLESLLQGKPADVAIHPRLPECDPRRALVFDFRWELESSPRQLWPFVTSTDRLDRAIGFPPVRYSTRFEPGRGVRTFAEGRKAGMAEIGEEHPYEWVEPRRMGVLREYSQGPFLWLVSTVELKPRSGGGTTLVHRLQFEPRTWKIRIGSPWGVGVGLRKRLESVYRRIDATVKSQSLRGTATEVDPFEDTAPLSGPRRHRLEQLLDRLIERGIDPTVVERLGEHLARGAPQEVARIRPLALAERLQLDPDQIVAACLHSAHEGLLELHWDLLCPVCRISCQITDTLRAIGEHAHCAACHLDFTLDFANSIELIFRVHPEIREADLGTYCIGGPAHSPHVLAQLRVAPHERIELELELAEGSYRLRGPQLPWTVDFPVRRTATIRRWEIDMASGPGLESDRPAALRPGGQVLVLNNVLDRELLVRVERTASRIDALTAARAASLALFRELFPGEILAPGHLATVSTVTLLVTALDPAQADALYQELGDARAFGVIHEYFQRLDDAIRHGGGAVVKTQGEGLLAAFSDVTAAVRTALELPAQLAGSATTRPLRLRVGVHRGPTLAATLNDHLDYFGSTARQAAGTLRYARCGELVLTQAVAADPEVAALLNQRRIKTEVIPAELGGQAHVIRVGLEAEQAGLAGA